MPRNNIHKIFDELCLGKTTTMHEEMDKWSKVLRSDHRKISHDAPTVALIAMTQPGDFLVNVLSGLIHIEVDELFSKTEKQIRRKEKYG